jgi:hypothetical protein
MSNNQTDYDIIPIPVQGGRGTTNWFPVGQHKETKMVALPPQSIELFKTNGAALTAGLQLFRDAATLQPEHLVRLKKLEGLVEEAHGYFKMNDEEMFGKAFITEMLQPSIDTWNQLCEKKGWVGVAIDLVADVYTPLGHGPKKNDDDEDKPKTILRKADEKGKPAAEKNDEPESTDQDNISSEDSDDGGDVLDVG